MNVVSFKSFEILNSLTCKGNDTININDKIFRRYFND